MLKIKKFLERTSVPYLSRRRAFLICLLIGITVARGLQGPEESGRSTFLVHLAPADIGWSDVGYFYRFVYRFDPSEGRELSSYARGDQVKECSWEEGSELRQCLRAREGARKFIYDHWRAKQRAYIAIDFPCRDCGPTMHVFIEPNEVGVWRIATIMEEPRYPPRRWPDAFDVKYRKANLDEREREQTPRLLSLQSYLDGEVRAF